ncbi:MAG: hypothetical protein M0Z94_19095 [Dehalococcoidales bacterium]|nr:hypothetical protein [Dehalococcoidales bacterium]
MAWSRFTMGTNSLVLFDGATNKVATTLANVGSGSGVAVNPTTNLVYVADAGKDAVAVVQGSSQAAAQTQTGTGQPTALPNTGQPALPTTAVLVAGLALVGLGLAIRKRVWE